MPQKFSIEEHEKRMREVLKAKPLEGQKHNILQSLLDKAKLKIKKPREEETIGTS